jgi:hypothetical protein
MEKNMEKTKDFSDDDVGSRWNIVKLILLIGGPLFKWGHSFEP